MGHQLGSQAIGWNCYLKTKAGIKLENVTQCSILEKKSDFYGFCIYKL